MMQKVIAGAFLIFTVSKTLLWSLKRKLLLLRMFTRSEGVLSAVRIQYITLFFVWKGHFLSSSCFFEKSDTKNTCRICAGVCGDITKGCLCVF